MSDPIDLTARGIDSALNTAFERQRTVVVAYVDGDDYPSVSFRGSLHVHSATQIALWSRKADAGIATGVADRPKVSVVYYGGHDGPGPAFLSMRGTARVAPELNDEVFAEMPEPEQRFDPEKAGVALVVDVTSVQGFADGAPFSQSI